MSGHGKGHFNNQKALELLGNNIFDSSNSAPYGNYNEKNSTGHYASSGSFNNERVHVSAAKRREMIGNDIFGNDSLAHEMEKNVRQPPGGRSNLKLI